MSDQRMLITKKSQDNPRSQRLFSATIIPIEYFVTSHKRQEHQSYLYLGLQSYKMVQVNNGLSSADILLKNKLTKQKTHTKQTKPQQQLKPTIQNTINKIQQNKTPCTIALL